MKRTILHKLFAFAILIYVSFWCGAGVSAQSIKWTTRAITPVTGGSGRNGAMCFTINNKIYVGGGYIAPSVNTKSFYEYDTATNIWTQKADLPVAANRSAGVGFAIGGKGYIGLGSENYLDIGGGALVQTDMWEYNPTSNTWTAKASIPDTGRNNSGCFVINNKAYIIGGEKTIGISGSTTNDVWEFDPAANVWTPKASFPLEQ